ncbi:MAG TPA: hypothetical protein VMV81_04865 [Phycisphaerae bacterium]|nr:hypothetical protein [Phycisphaerae bacterium]
MDKAATNFFIGCFPRCKPEVDGGTAPHPMLCAAAGANQFLEASSGVIGGLGKTSERT